MCNSNLIIKLAKHKIICTCSVNVRCSDTAVLSTGPTLSECPRAIEQSLFLSRATQKTVQMKCLSNWTHTHLCSPFRQVIRTVKTWYSTLKGHFTVIHIHSFSVFCSLCLVFPVYTIIHRDFLRCVCAYVGRGRGRYKRMLTMFIW